MASYESDFFIMSHSFPPQSAGGCQQTLSLIPQGNFYRTINGKLVYEAPAGFHKYQTVVQCLDKNSPGLEGMEQGALLQVGCLVFFQEEMTSEQGRCVLKRPPVSGSVVVYDRRGQGVPGVQQEQDIKIEASFFREGSLFVRYRPLLTMRLQNFHLQRKEWEGEVQWTLHAEEV